MYLPSSAPLPPNNRQPLPPWQVACGTNQVARLDQAAANALSAVMCPAAPSSFADFSVLLPGVVAAGQDSISPLNPPSASDVAQTATATPSDIALAPRVRPLNDLNWGKGCNMGTVSTAPQPQVLTGSAPVLAAKVNPPPTMRAPSWSNLCWALRNGLVDASQFDPAELSALQYRCSQLGYVGSCPPPPDVAAYLNANSGKLPHISVSDEDLKMIPRAPDVQGLTCAGSYAVGGLSGVPWGDAGRMTCGNSGMSEFAKSPWAALALVAVVALGVGFVVGR